MPRFTLSPAVVTREIDLTTYVPSVSTTEAALAGVFRWGPIGQRVLIDHETEFVKRFGKPNNINPETFFSGASFLSYSNRMYVSRAANTEGKTPSVTCNVTSSNTTVTLSTGNTAELEAGMISISSANAGMTNGAVIGSVINSTAFTITDSTKAAATATEDAIQFVTNTAFSAVANTAAVGNLEYQIVKNETHFTEKDGNFDTDVKFVARYPGELGNSLRISVCGNSTGYQSTINLASYGTYSTMTVNNNSNTVVFSIAGNSNTDNSANSTAIKALLNVTDLIEAGNTLLGTQYLKITAVSSDTTYGTATKNAYVVTTVGNNLISVANSTGGEEAAAANTDDIVANMQITAGDSNHVGLVVNNIINTTAFYATTNATITSNAFEVTVAPRVTFNVSMEDRFKLASDFQYVSTNATTRTFKRQWEFFNLIDKTPGQSDYVINFGNSSINNDEMHVVVVDEDGEFTGVPGTVLEKYESLSLATDAKTIDGANNYYRTALNNRSAYVYAVNDISGATSNTALNLANSTLDVVSYNFGLGRDGKDESNIPISVLSTAYDLFQDGEEVDVRLIISGKSRSYTLPNYLIDNIAETRKDCVVFVSPQYGDVVNNAGNEADACIAFRNNLRSSSYAFLDSGYKYMYDRYNDTYRWVPLNGDMAGLCARTDLTNASWWSPAGYNRGKIKNIVKLAWNPRKAFRDELYKSDVNPVFTERQAGSILIGDKTLLGKPSAFNRINVRRLFIVLEKSIATASKYTLFEFNDEFTRAAFKNLVVPYLRTIKGARGITGFEVVCNEDNNPGAVTDDNSFVADIYLKPARSINEVVLNFIAVGTDVSFNEVIGRY